jgi:hypothetical protein
MAKYSKMMMGKEVGDAKVYAPPHTMKGEKVVAKENPGSGKNMSRADTVEMTVGNINKSSGGTPKTSGIKMRGTGAATKGLMSRGPMA